MCCLCTFITVVMSKRWQDKWPLTFPPTETCPPVTSGDKRTEERTRHARHACQPKSCVVWASFWATAVRSETTGHAVRWGTSWRSRCKSTRCYLLTEFVLLLLIFILIQWMIHEKSLTIVVFKIIHYI